MKRYRLWEVIYTVENDFTAVDFGSWYFRVRGPWGAINLFHGRRATNIHAYISGLSVEWGQRMMYLAESFVWFRQSRQVIFRKQDA